MLAETPLPSGATNRTPAKATASSRSAVAAYLPAALVVLAAMLFHLVTERTPVFPVDDAYITLHNAQVLHLGHDPNYAGVPALAGATSPFHLALVSALLFVLQPLWALDIAAWLGVFAFALGIARLCRSQSVPPGPAFLLVVAGLLAARTPHQLMNGLETGWALAGIAWALAFASEEGPAAALALAAVCGTLPFLRPELAALSALLLPLPAWRARRSSRNPAPALQAVGFAPAARPAIAHSKPSLPAALSVLGKCALVAALAASPWMLWQLAATGSIVPATIAAKRYYFAEANLSKEIKWIFVEGSLVALLRACGPLCVAALALPFTRIGRIALTFTAILLAAYYCQFPGALTHAQSRYLYIVLPFLIFGAASAFRLLARWPAPCRWMTLFAAVAACQAALLAPFTWREHQAEQAKTRYELAGVAAWCDKNLPPESRLLIHDAGYISYATRFQMEDLVGLKTPSNITFHRDLTYPTNGAQRATAIHAAALRARADYIIVLDLWDGIFKITDGLRHYGWRLDPVRTEGIYRVYRLSRVQSTPTA